MELRDEFVSSDGVTLHVTRAGEGFPVVLLHGFPENSRSWRWQIPALVDAGFSVWALDLRGYGKSSKPAGREAYHLSRLVEDVAAVVRRSGSPKAHIVGHDWGGIIAWTFAGLHPELTARLVVLNAPHMRMYLREVRRPPQMLMSMYVLFFQLPWLPERFLSAGNFSAIRKVFRDTPAKEGAFREERIEAYVEALSRPGALTAALNYYRANFRRGPLEIAASACISVPTLVIWGEQDFALSRQLLVGLEQVVEDLTVHRVPDAGHWVQNEVPHEVNRALVDFLRRET